MSDQGVGVRSHDIIHYSYVTASDQTLSQSNMAVSE